MSFGCEWANFTREVPNVVSLEVQQEVAVAQVLDEQVDDAWALLVSGDGPGSQTTMELHFSLKHVPFQFLY